MRPDIKLLEHALEAMTAECELHFVRRGSGAPLLLIQGTAATHLHWGERFVTLLASSFDVVAYDHRGVGYSAPVRAPFSLADLADDAARLIDEIGWDRAAVFGVSLGGVVAQELGLRHPERVERLVLGCTSAGGATRSRAREMSATRELSAVRVRGDPEATLRNLFRLGVKDPDSVCPEAWAEYQHAAMSLPVNPRTTVQQIDAFARHLTVGRLPELEVPAHVVHGEADRMTDLADGALVARAIPAARFTILPAGHLFWLELPEVTATLIKDFSLAERTKQTHGHPRYVAG